MKEPGGHVSMTGGPAWGAPLSSLLHESEANRDLIEALNGDFDGAERSIRDRIERRAHEAGYEMSPAASLRATKDRSAR